MSTLSSRMRPRWPVRARPELHQRGLARAVAPDERASSGVERRRDVATASARRPVAVRTPSKNRRRRLRVGRGRRRAGRARRRIAREAEEGRQGTGQARTSARPSRALARRESAQPWVKTARQSVIAPRRWRRGPRATRSPHRHAVERERRGWRARTSTARGGRAARRLIPAWKPRWICRYFSVTSARGRRASPP